MEDYGFPLVSRPGGTSSSQGHSGTPVPGTVAGVPSSAPGGFVQAAGAPGAPIGAQAGPPPIAGAPGRTPGYVNWASASAYLPTGESVAGGILRNASGGVVGRVGADGTVFAQDANGNWQPSGSIRSWAGRAIITG